MRYHLCRRGFWDTCNRTNKVLGALSGSAVIVGITAGWAFLTTLSALIVAVFSVFDLVFDSSPAMVPPGPGHYFGAHADRRKFAELLGRRLKIEMEEGPCLDLLERRCSYDESKARGDPIDEAWKLTPNERRFAQFIFWRPAKR
jgi:hypothetical protein